jgi:hypothetical protein
MNVEDKNLNDHINLLEIKLEKIYQEKAHDPFLVPQIAILETHSDDLLIL